MNSDTGAWLISLFCLAEDFLLLLITYFHPYTPLWTDQWTLVWRGDKDQDWAETFWPQDEHQVWAGRTKVWDLLPSLPLLLQGGCLCLLQTSSNYFGRRYTWRRNIFCMGGGSITKLPGRAHFRIPYRYSAYSTLYAGRKFISGLYLNQQLIVFLRYGVWGGR